MMFQAQNTPTFSKHNLLRHPRKVVSQDVAFNWMQSIVVIVMISSEQLQNNHGPIESCVLVTEWIARRSGKVNAIIMTTLFTLLKSA